MIAWIFAHFFTALGFYVSLSFVIAFIILMIMRSDPKIADGDGVPFLIVVVFWPLALAVGIVAGGAWLFKNFDKLMIKAADNALALIGKGK